MYERVRNFPGSGVGGAASCGIIVLLRCFCTGITARETYLATPVAVNDSICVSDRHVEASMKFLSKKRSSSFDIRFAAFWATTFTLALLCLTACNSQQSSDEQLKQQAAQTTQQVKQGAKEAAADAKVAAANAERKVNDIAAGVKEGMKSNGKPAAGVVNINSATEEQLVDLPGITGARAQRIIRGRPYDTPHDLVSKGILTDAQFGRISTQITAN
jgi:DNA uptake protein ComE-like DNA-binding protein